MPPAADRPDAADADGPPAAASPPDAAADVPSRQRDYLLRIARAMSAELDPREVLALVIRAAVAITGGHAGAIAMRRGHGAPGPLRLVASYRLDARMAQMLGEIVELEQVDDAGRGDRGGVEAPRAPEPAAPGPDPIARGTALVHVGPAAGDGPPEDTHQVLTLPLRVGEAALGRIVVFRGEGAAVFTPVDEGLLGAFADQAAVAIQNALLHQRLAARERQLTEVLAHAASGLLVLDPSGRIVHANAAAERLTGLARGVLVGRMAPVLLGLENDAGVPLALPLPDRPEATASVRGRLRVAGREAPGPWVQAAVTAVAGVEEAIDGYVADLTDLSAWREAEHAKTAFLGGLSHELKTPLSIIRGFAETLRHNPTATADPAFRANATDVILAETERLTGMVDRLLETARLEVGALRLDVAPVDLGALLARLVEEMRTARPGRPWRLAGLDDAPPIAGDAARLREVFAELLANADKYAAPGEPVVVALEASGAPPGDGVAVTVSDTGPGIADEDLPRVFERFYRAADRPAGVDGTGLGLYTARAVVEAHGGTIGVASSPGRGSTFTVRLPRLARGGVTPRLGPPGARAVQVAGPPGDQAAGAAPSPGRDAPAAAPSEAVGGAPASAPPDHRRAAPADPMEIP